MPKELIDNLGNRDALAGDQLSDDFKFAPHMFIRFRTMCSALQEYLRLFDWSMSNPYPLETTSGFNTFVVSKRHPTTTGQRRPSREIYCGGKATHDSCGRVGIRPFQPRRFFERSASTGEPSPEHAQFLNCKAICQLFLPHGLLPDALSADALLFLCKQNTGISLRSRSVAIWPFEG